MSHGPFGVLSFECHKDVICGVAAPGCGDGVHRLLNTGGSSRQFVSIYYILAHRNSYTLLTGKMLPSVIDFICPCIVRLCPPHGLALSVGLERAWRSHTTVQSWGECHRRPAEWSMFGISRGAGYGLVTPASGARH